MKTLKEIIIKINNFTWKIPTSYRSDMRVPAIIFATESMLDEILKDRSLEQLINVTTLPGIRKAAFVMPDVHEGYGFPIGGVAATKYPDGVISPGGIGYDINCGVRLLRSELFYNDIRHHLEKLSKHLFREIPSGVGHTGSLKLGVEKLDAILQEGAHRLIKEGYGEEIDTHYIESYGVLDNADPSVVSDNAKKRGQDQLGTIGGGNHFVEVDRIDEMFDEQTANEFGLQYNQIVILIHTGSRGLGHQVATDYVRLINQAMMRYGISVPDRELACVPLSTNEGRNYFNAMAASANFAWANRQMITYEIRRVWKDIFGDSGGRLSVFYDVAHNIAKIEEHEIDDIQEKVIVHRKGATRAFPPFHPELVGEYQKTGQPVIIPGSMGTASYVLVGTLKGKEAFYSSCHGAGRLMSRHQARKMMQGRELQRELKEEGIYVQSDSVADLAEEAPFAYKNIDEVVEVVDKLGLATKVAKLKPLIVVKG
ncbi:MAG: RNA-splicing ligase RtcB [Patescibacteria group bacterium]|nr:MAG: RNA-splicing ligase RtcB [Patescibacteria group bacterium]